MSKILKILSEEEYNPATMTYVASFNTTVNHHNIGEFLPVDYVFDIDDISVRLKGKGNIFNDHDRIIGITTGKRVRGIAKKVMNNMVSIDYQYDVGDEKKSNNHIKLSDTKMNIIGTRSVEHGNMIMEIMIQKIKDLKKELEKINKLSFEDKQNAKEWILMICKDMISTHKYMRRAYFCNYKVPEKLNKNLLFFLSFYIDDFEDAEGSKFEPKSNFEPLEAFSKKIDKIYENPEIYKEDLKIVGGAVMNSVYHFDLIDTKRNPGYIAPLHKLAHYLYNKGFKVEFHNTVSNCLKIIFDIQEEKSSTMSQTKEYKHRFEVKVNGKGKITSPTFKSESYRYYFGTMKMIQKFYEEGEDKKSYLKYVDGI